MKILLVNPPKEQEFSLFVLDDYNTKARSNQPPLGLMYLASYLKPDYEVDILDMNALEMSIADIETVIDNFNPDIVGITCVIGKWITVKGLAETIKSCTNVPVVVGGVNPSLYPWETLHCTNIDYVVSGFGQIPFKELCKRIENKDNTHLIPNVHTHKNCSSETKGSFTFVNIDEFPVPDKSILPIDDYTMPYMPENPTTSMVTSLGCPFSCSFCACRNFQPVKLRSPGNIVAEMKGVESLGIRSVLFQDELFTMSSRRIHDICSLIIKNDVNLNWSVRSRANLVNEEALLKMAVAGCFNIHLGIESGTDRILGEMNKKLTIDTIKKSVGMIQDAGLMVSASFMLGYPDETEEEILQTIQFAKELNLNNAQFYLTQPEPKTELYEQLKEIKNLPDDIYAEFVLNPDDVDLTKSIASTIFTKEQLEDFLKLAYSETNNLYKINEKANEK